MSKKGQEENQIQEVIQLGYKNQSLMPDVQNWCSHLQLEDVSSGIVAQMYRIPISVKVDCPHAKRAKQSMHLDLTATEFIATNYIACTNHQPIATGGFGQNVLDQLEKDKKEEIASQERNAHQKELLDKRVKELIDNQKSDAVVELSILKMLGALQPLTTDPETLQRLSEASKLQPAFFTELCLNVLAMFFSDEAIGKDCLQTACNAIKGNGLRPASCLDSAVAAVQNSPNFDEAAAFIWLYPAQESFAFYNKFIGSLLPRLTFERFPGDPFYTDERYPASINLLSFLCTHFRTEIVGMLQKQLAINNKSTRINTNKIIQQLLSGNRDIIDDLLVPLARSFELVDDMFMLSADRMTCETIACIIKYAPAKYYPIVKREGEKLSSDAALEYYFTYRILLEDEDFCKAAPEIVNEIIGDFIKIAVDRDKPYGIRETIFSLLGDFRKDELQLLKPYLDKLLGVLSHVLEEEKTFHWYKNQLNLSPENITTFNPLVGKNPLDIQGDQMKIEKFIRELNTAIAGIIKADTSGTTASSLAEFIKKLSSKDHETYKCKLLSVFRLGLKDRMAAAKFIPDLYVYLLDKESLQVRKEAMQILVVIAEKLSELLTKTLTDLVDVFLEDTEKYIKVYALHALNELVSNGLQVTDKHHEIILAALGNPTIGVHKAAVAICRNTMFLIEDKRRYSYYDKLANLELVYSESEDIHFCEEIVDAMLSVGGNNEKYFKFTMEQFVAKHCLSKDEYFGEKMMRTFSDIVSEMPQFTSLWFKTSLEYLKITRPDINGHTHDYRHTLYNKYYALSYEIITSHIPELKDTIVYTLSKYPVEGIYLLVILAYFELHELAVQIIGDFRPTLKKTASNESFYNFMGIIHSYSQLELAIAKKAPVGLLLSTLKDELQDIK